MQNTQLVSPDRQFQNVVAILLMDQEIIYTCCKVLEPRVTQNTKCHLKVQLVLEFPL